jgi:16S rRNA (guanine527-N7)-methyltransferase
MASSTLQLLVDTVAGEARRMRTDVDDQQATQIARFIDLLARWAGHMRLTASDDPHTLIERHLPDALALLRVLPDASRGARCIDVGSGGGLPAIPVAILRPDLQLTLVEPNGKKCAFLRTAAHELQIDTEVSEARVESLPLDQTALADIVWSRATFPPVKWLAVARKLVGPQAQVALFVARAESLPAPPPPGLRPLRTVTYALSDGAPRLLATYERVTTDQAHPPAQP